MGPLFLGKERPIILIYPNLRSKVKISGWRLRGQNPHCKDPPLTFSVCFSVCLSVCLIFCRGQLLRGKEQHA